MSDPNTIRILEIDGGGARGYLPLCWLQKFIALWGIEQNQLWKYFDVICGTSIGGIQAIAYAYGLGPNDLASFFTVTAPNVFTVLYPASSITPNAVYKAILIGAGIPFYQSSGPFAALYGSGLLRATMNTVLETATMQDLQTNVVIPSYNNDTNTYVNFSNVTYGNFIGQNELLQNIAIATGSAPVYLPPLFFPEGSELYNPDAVYGYIDGGVYNNNPSAFGLSLAQGLKKNANRYCILSLGTGIGEMGFDEGGEPPPPPSEISRFISDPAQITKYMAAYEYADSMGKISNLKGNPLTNIGAIFGLFSIASTGSQESTSLALSLGSADYTLNQTYYYRFQPQLDTADYNTELDNTQASFFTYLQNLANSSFDDDIENISAFLGHLTA